MAELKKIKIFGNYKNKKAIGFFSLIAPISILFLALLFITHISNNNSSQEDVDFGKIIKNVDLIQSEIHVEEFYRDELFHHLFDNLRLEYINNLNYNSKLEEIKNSDLSCSYDNIPIWYNSENKDISIKKENDENLNEDNQNGIENTNLDEKENLQKDKENIEVQNHCLPNFSENFDEDFASYLKNKISFYLEKGEDIQDIKDLNIDVNYDKSSNLFDININSTYKLKSKFAEIKKPLNFEYKYSLGSYPDLLLVLEKILPKLSDNFKENIPICLDDSNSLKEAKKQSKTIEDYCLMNSFNKLVLKEKNGKKILDNYEFKITNYDKLKKKGYYSLLFNIYQKNEYKINLNDDGNKIDNENLNNENNPNMDVENGNKQGLNNEKIEPNLDSNLKEFINNEIKFKDKNALNQEPLLKFLVQLKDNIPYGEVSFSLSNSNIYDNVIEVTINKPSFKIDNNDKYVIVYGYTDFIKNEKLKDLLNNKDLNRNFDQIGYSEPSPVNINNIYYLKDDSKFKNNFDVDLAVVSNDGFDNGKKKILLYQKYNQDLKKFELLNNKDLFVYVFAVDKNNNYFINGFTKRKSRFILPISNLGPFPLKAENIKLNSDLPDMEKSFTLNINKYYSKKFAYYDLYIMKNRGENDINPKCQNSDYACYYFNGINELNSKNLDLLISSDPDSKPLNDMILIDSRQFTKFNNEYLNLNNAEEFELFVAPVDINGNFISKKIMSYSEPKLIPGGISYRFSSKENSLFLTPFTLKFTIKDNKGPNPLNSIVNNVLSLDSENYLMWKYEVNQGYDVNKVIGKLVFIDDSGSTSPIDVQILKDGYIYDKMNNKIKFNSQKYNSAVLNNLYPMDSFGNIDSKFDGITYIARLD